MCLQVSEFNNYISYHNLDYIKTIISFYVNNMHNILWYIFWNFHNFELKMSGIHFLKMLSQKNCW